MEIKPTQPPIANLPQNQAKLTDPTAQASLRSAYGENVRLAVSQTLRQLRKHKIENAESERRRQQQITDEKTAETQSGGKLTE